ncbi:hypothetical protein JCM11251_007880 [Rhodosporidiobolus azoricus]
MQCPKQAAKLDMSSPPPASFHSLPYEIVSLIASHLDPSPSRSAYEAPSVTRERRDAGRALALVCRSAREAGTEFVWRRVVVGFHHNPDLLRRICEERWMAEYVKQFHMRCSPKHMAIALGMDLAGVLSLFTTLDELSVGATPRLIENIISYWTAAAICPLTRLDVDSTFASCPSFPSFLLTKLPLFSHLTHLTLGLRFHAETYPGAFKPLVFGSTAHVPLSRLHELYLIIEDVPTHTYPALTAFFASLLSLLPPLTHLRSFSLFSPYAPDFLFTCRGGSLLQSPSSLTSCTVSLPIGPLIARLPSLLELLPSLSQLKKLEVLVRNHDDASLILPSSHPLRPPLFASLANLDTLESVELDFDLMDNTPLQAGSDTAIFLASRLQGAAGSKLRMWQTVEWEEGLRFKRAVVAARQMDEEGREGWTELG